ncbi:MAG TPA: ribonuclease H-like domain-containing protein [Candidatus Dormibacteraeota bacterium]|nr:ribonuclease H-like domain-containing protein [Candidatus Dormibacteraeota bacterium]
MPPGFEAVETAYGTAWRFADVLAPGRLPGPPPAIAHAYLDTETTGLSGGAGTQVFAVAICRPTEAGLELAQVFLADPAGEAAFLALVQDEVASAGGLATYNGGRFDLPLLRTRWVMARMPGDLQHPAHVDLLDLTRSLLRTRLERCTLRHVEERLLGFERERDLASALVPEAYLAYLRHGWSPMLPMALEHNRQDVVSLYYLHARLLLRLQGRDPWMEGTDWLALGRHLFRHGHRADGWRALRNAAEMADGPDSARAALLLARRLKRRRRPAAAERLLNEVDQKLAHEPRLAIARARLLEWSLGDLEQARAVVSSALEHLPPDSPYRTDLEWRLQRLHRKLAGGPAAAQGLRQASE